MEAFAHYLFRSVIWLTGFAVVYLLFLRNERFFLLKRFYLVSGILVSLFFPLISVHYQVELPAPDLNHVDLTPAGNSIITAIQEVNPDNQFDYRYILLFLYLAGVLFFAFKLIWNIRSLYKTIKKANINNRGPAKLIRAFEYSSSFSFFNYVFINPSVSETEMEEILNHELVHVSQKHWFDLLSIELLRLLQWVNPFVWIYTGFIRLNHEYLADEAALQRTSNPVIYRAVLLNQMFRSPVISLSNSFNYSLNKKRFDMMKRIITSPYRKMKVLLVLPVFAIVFYSFAKPEYRYTSPVGNPGDQNLTSLTVAKVVKGIVIQEDGKPLQGVTVIGMLSMGAKRYVKCGTITDIKGFFVLDSVPDEAILAFSYIGFKSLSLKPDFGSEMTVKMIRYTVNTGKVNINPSPQFSTGLKIKGNGHPPLYVLDGVIKDSIDINKIDPKTIESIHVYKEDYSGAVQKYGEKGKYGVIEIKTKKNDSQGNGKKISDVKVTEDAGKQKTNENKFIAVEEMPMFPAGGEKGMLTWISENLKYPDEAVKEKITGLVNVSFVVSSTGKIKNVQVKKPVHPLLDDEAIRVISNMPDWKPGRQNGKAVDVDYMVPVDFKLQYARLESRQAE